jgi:hypothetical protein
MRHAVRASVACMTALACLGASNAGARQQATLLSVQICAPDRQPANCGPRAKVGPRRQLGVRFPTLAKRAGVVVVSAPRLKIKCPGVCEATIPGAVRVTITAKATQDPSQGSYSFDHWEGSCAGQPETCTLNVGRSGNARAVVVFHSSYRSSSG